jgi:hypothetical protein
MIRSTILALAAVAALATTPSLAASAVSTTTENLGNAARQHTQYAFGGLSGPIGTDAAATGSIGVIEPGYIPYLGGVGDPLGLTSPVYTDATETGSIGADEPWRVNVREFCEGEGKELAERHHIGFCHLAYDH